LSNTNFKIIPNSKNLNKKIFKIKKISNQKGPQIVFHKELRNPDSPFTHTEFFHYMSGTLYSGLSCLEIEGIV